MVGVGLLALILVSILVIAVHRPIRTFFYPLPPPLPPVVEEDMPALLQQYEVVLRDRCPDVLAVLRPGLSEDDIASLESKYTVQFPDDLRALYMWRDGMESIGTDFVPGHEFRPLEQALELRVMSQSEAKLATPLQRAAHATFAGHRHAWIGIFEDAAGDGYFYDPDRSTQEGYFFFHFAEDAQYVFFASPRNFIAGVLDGFASGVYSVNADGEFEVNYDRAFKLWDRYGAANVR